MDGWTETIWILTTTDWPIGLVVPLTAKPEVVGSIPTQDKFLCDEHEYLFWVWVSFIYISMYLKKNKYVSISVVWLP